MSITTTTVPFVPKPLFLWGESPSAQIEDGPYALDRKGNISKVEKTEGFYVSLFDTGLTRRERLGVTWDGTGFDFLHLHREDLENGLLFGVWRDGGTIALDVSCWIVDREKAIEFGLKNRQLAIWDIAAGEAIFLAELPATA